MERQSIVGQIYGYGVSLIAILIIVIAIHGIVNAAFRVVNPTAGGHGPRIAMMWRVHGGPGMGGPGMGGPGFARPGFGGPGFGGGFRHHFGFGRGNAGTAGSPAATASAAPGTDQGPVNAMQPNANVTTGGPGAEMRGKMLGNARFDAFRMLVLQIVMLIVGIVLLRWHWNWLHTTRTA